jgi:ribokinase
MDIAVVGSNMVDLVAYIDQMPHAGETLEADDFAMGCGGKGANQAVAAAKLGAGAVRVPVGDDVFADNTIANLTRHGIDTRHVGACRGVPAASRRSSSTAAARTASSSSRARTARCCRRTSIAAAADIARCRLVVLQLEIPLETVYRTIEVAQEAGVPVLLNPAPANRALDLAQACRCDYVVPNESELAILTGRRSRRSRRAHGCAQSLRARGLRDLIVTLGANGALHLGPARRDALPRAARRCDRHQRRRRCLRRLLRATLVATGRRRDCDPPRRAIRIPQRHGPRHAVVVRGCGGFRRVGSRGRQEPGQLGGGRGRHSNRPRIVWYFSM